MKYSEFSSVVKSTISQQILVLENDRSEDVILDAFRKYFQSTPELNFEEILKIVSEGELRYKNKIPPGYLDEDDKIGFQKFGDLIL